MHGQKNVYQLLTLPERVNQQALPSIDIIDMRAELSSGNRSMFSEELRQAIQDRLNKNEQIVLFLNRRVMLRLCYVEIVDMFHNVHIAIFR